MLRYTQKYQVLLDGYNLWMKYEQLRIMDYCITTYGCPGLIVYNLWIYDVRISSINLWNFIFIWLYDE